MRLIDADTLNYVRVRIYHDDGTIGGYNAVVPSSEIKNAPTVDAVPVIRCKDCKHMVEHKWYGYLGESAYTCESNMDGWILPDSYCSMAERKEECGHQ